MELPWSFVGCTFVGLRRSHSNRHLGSPDEHIHIWEWGSKLRENCKKKKVSLLLHVYDKCKAWAGPRRPRHLLESSIQWCPQNSEGRKEYQESILVVVHHFVVSKKVSMRRKITHLTIFDAVREVEQFGSFIFPPSQHLIRKKRVPLKNQTVQTNDYHFLASQLCHS